MFHYERELPEQVDPSHWRRNYLRPTKVKPEELKRLLDDMVQEAGVQVRFFSRAVDVDLSDDEHRVNGVVTHSVDGCRAVRPNGPDRRRP